jgi:hypothetical protein
VIESQQIIDRELLVRFGSCRVFSFTHIPGLGLDTGQKRWENRRELQSVISNATKVIETSGHLQSRPSGGK